MKKLLLALLVLFVATTLFVACGEKKEEPAKDDVKTEETTEKPVEETKVEGNLFEGKMLSFTLPKGWTAKEDAGSINIEKEGDPLMGITVMELEGNSAPIDDVINATADMFKDSKPTISEVTIGANTYKKLSVTIATINTETLYIAASNGIVSITSIKLDDPDVKAMLESVVLK